jgi:outer membrane protein assembly factor BamB
VTIGVAVVAALVIAGLVLWSKSPVELLSDGPTGRLTPVGQGVPAGPARYSMAADEPVLVSGAAVVLDGASVRALRLDDPGTYWTLSRPGGVTPQSLWSIDDQHVAVAWSDGRLTLVDVPTGRHWDLYPPQYPLPVADYSSSGVPGPELAVYGLPAAGGAPAVAVLVQPGQIEAYDLATGRPAWTYTPPSGQVVEDPTSDAQPTGALLLVNLSTGANSPADSVVLDGKGRITMRASYQSTASAESSGDVPVAVGDGRVAVGEGSYFRILDAASGRTLYTVPMGDSPYDIAGGAGVIVTGGREDGPVSAYDASDGRMLWRHQYSGPGAGLGNMVMDLAVYGGEVRLLELEGGNPPACLANYRMLTIDPTGRIVGVKPLSAFDCQPLDIFPQFIEGRDGALIVEDNASIAVGHSNHTYIYVGSGRQQG